MADSPATTSFDPNIGRLYRATFLFGVACGISIALSSLHLDALGFTKPQIGTLAAWFASGVVGMAIPAGAIIRRFSARSALLAYLGGYAICVAGFPFLRDYSAIAAIRAVDGACSVGVWVASETILLSRADKAHKAHLTSLYAVWLSCGYVAGPVLANIVTRFASMQVAFVLAGAITIASGLYAWLTFDDDGLGRESPANEEGAPTGPPTSAGTILWRIKNSCFGALAYGYFQASVVIFLPLFLIESKAIPRDKTIVLPGLFCLGMLLTSNLAGRVADRIGHLLVMRVLSTLGGATVLGFVFLDHYLAMYAAVIFAGATLAAMSPVSLALQGVVTEKKDYSRSNAIYNVFYAAGMLLGPPASSAIFGAKGGEAMLYHLAALWAVFVVFTIVFMHDDPAVRRKREAAAASAA
jgi:predicted MFS family arabinose efflux permease